MAGAHLNQQPLAFAFGILGNIISFMVYLAPLPTFYRIFRRKSTEGFQSVPYVVALFSAMLWIYYAFVKTNDYILLTINSFGCFIQTFYIAVFMAYANRSVRISTAKLLLLLNVGLFSMIVLFTILLSKGPNRLRILGWICVAFAVSVFAAPLSIMRLVIRTKSVEYMPFNLSLFLTLSAIAWFFYGFFSHDNYVALPNVLGFTFGIAQMVLYMCYRNSTPSSKSADPEVSLTQLSTATVKQPDVVIVGIIKGSGEEALAGLAGGGPEVHPVDGTSDHDDQVYATSGNHDEEKGGAPTVEIQVNP